MALATSYSLKLGSFSAYFDAIHSAEVPERFSATFLEELGFEQTNDRQFIGVLKDIGFIDADGKPTERYIEYLDKNESGKVIAEGLREGYSDLFAINKEAYRMDMEALKGKLKVLFKGKKSDLTVDRIARTFLALCELADFQASKAAKKHKESEDEKAEAEEKKNAKPEEDKDKGAVNKSGEHSESGALNIKGLQYHINIVLPESRDPSIYDAIFSSLRRHLG